MTKAAEPKQSWVVMLVLAVFVLIAAVFLIGAFTDPKDLQRSEDGRAIKECRSLPDTQAKRMACGALEQQYLNRYGRLP